MISVSMREAKTKLSALIETVENTDEVVLICRNGKPAARLSCAKSKHAINPLMTHPELQGRILYDPTEAATNEDWPMVVGMLVYAHNVD